MKYYPIDESAARRAKQANSLSDYAERSATSEYRREVDRAATLAEECKKGKTEAQQDKIDYLLDRYARRLADNMNASNRNRASCPSVMVAGWSNFPVRKKQQQLSRDDTLMREWRDIQGILDQIRAVGHGGISGMDADARERVQAVRSILLAATALKYGASREARETTDDDLRERRERTAEMWAETHDKIKAQRQAQETE